MTKAGKRLIAAAKEAIEIARGETEAASYFRPCPHCGANLDGGPIPEKDREWYSPPYRWAREIGIYDMSRDRTIAWKCPDCGGEWPR